MGVKDFVGKYFLGHDDESEQEVVPKKTKPPEKTKASKPKPAAKPVQTENKTNDSQYQTKYTDYNQGRSYLPPKNDLNGGKEMNERFKSSNANNGSNNSNPYSRQANSYSSQPQQSSNGMSGMNNMNTNSNGQNGTNREVKIAAQTTLQIVLARPVEFGEAKAIAKELNNQKTVLLNLELVEQKEARRILDFLAGVAFANDGDIKMMAQNTFAFMPKNVGFSGVDLMSELENNGLGF